MQTNQFTSPKENNNTTQCSLDIFITLQIFAV